jgi:hypothetical protein
MEGRQHNKRRHPKLNFVSYDLSNDPYNHHFSGLRRRWKNESVVQRALSLPFEQVVSRARELLPDRAAETLFTPKPRAF